MNQFQKQSIYYAKPPKFVTQKSTKTNSQTNNNLLNKQKELHQFNQLISPQFLQPNITNTTINNQSYQMIFPYQMTPQNLCFQGYQNQVQMQYLNNQNIAQNNQIIQNQNYINNNINNINNKVLNNINNTENIEQKNEKVKFLTKKVRK